MTKLPISVLILTKNEENNMPGCLESVSFTDDIHVLDSESDDGTVELAKKAGANVATRKLDHWGDHQNWALRNLPYKYDWVFYIDADERITPSLLEAMKKVVENPGPEVSYNVRRRDFFMGTWLKHTQSTPYYQRFFLHKKMAFGRKVHPIPMPDGPIGVLPGYLDHFPFSKGLSQWFERHNLYSSTEAEILMQQTGDDTPFSWKELFFGRSMQDKRMHMKKLYYKMPFRPQLKFLILYVLKGGFLDGRAGLTYARLIAMYETMIVFKVQEKKKGV